MIPRRSFSARHRAAVNGSRLAVGIFIAFVLLGMVIALTACGAPESGDVVGKRYKPPSSHTEQHCMMYASNSMCRMYTYDTVQDPESYQLRLSDGDKEGWRKVSLADYQRFDKGDHYP